MFDFNFGHSPLPGMNPYLEWPVNWSDFHSTYIHAIREAINEKLPGNYYARIGELVMMIAPESAERTAGEPDVFVGRNPSLGNLPPHRSAGTATLEPVTLAHVQYLDPHTELFIDILRLPGEEVVTVV